MLTFWGNQSARLCDGVSRRAFLKVGTLAMGGLTLADLFRLRAQGTAPKAARQKSVIMIWLQGGPSQIDTYDLKPNLPAEYRGEFKPIHTKVPGFDICEHLPRQAEITDKLALIRSLHFKANGHDAVEVFCGYPWPGVRAPLPNHPHIGCAVSRFRENHPSTLPRYVDFVSGFQRVTAGPAFLGPKYQGFRADEKGEGLDILALRRDLTLDRLGDRKALLQTLDSVTRTLDRANGPLAGVDAMQVRALDMITNTQTRDAFDVSKEPEKVRARYPKAGAPLLLARRLVEAGVSFVSTMFGSNVPLWDTHQKNCAVLKEHLPDYDRSIHALVTDLYERGLDKDVLVVACGEMGRNPRIDNLAGRGHWPEAAFCLLAGGVATGQVIGATTRLADRPATQPYSMQNVLATIYKFLGIDPHATLPDQQGRPMPLLTEAEPIAGL
jgi:hypothetical protein